MFNGQHYIEGQWQSGTADQLSRLVQLIKV